MRRHCVDDFLLLSRGLVCFDLCRFRRLWPVGAQRHGKAVCYSRFCIFHGNMAFGLVFHRVCQAQTEVLASHVRYRGSLIFFSGGELDPPVG